MSGPLSSLSFIPKAFNSTINYFDVNGVINIAKFFHLVKELNNSAPKRLKGLVEFASKIDPAAKITALFLSIFSLTKAVKLPQNIEDLKGALHFDKSIVWGFAVLSIDVLKFLSCLTETLTFYKVISATANTSKLAQNLTYLEGASQFFGSLWDMRVLLKFHQKADQDLNSLMQEKYDELSRECNNDMEDENDMHNVYLTKKAASVRVESEVTLALLKQSIHEEEKTKLKQELEELTQQQKETKKGLVAAEKSYKESLVRYKVSKNKLEKATADRTNKKDVSNRQYTIVLLKNVTSLLIGGWLLTHPYLNKIKLNNKAVFGVLTIIKIALDVFEKIHIYYCSDNLKFLADTNYHRIQARANTLAKSYMEDAINNNDLNPNSTETPEFATTTTPITPNTEKKPAPKPAEPGFFSKDYWFSSKK